MNLIGHVLTARCIEHQINQQLVEQQIIMAPQGQAQLLARPATIMAALAQVELLRVRARPRRMM